MSTRLVNGGRIRNGNFEAFNKQTKKYDSLGTDSEGNNLGKVNKDDFGKTQVGVKTNYTGSNENVRNSGIVTSDSASTTVKNSRDTLNNIGSGTGSTVTPPSGGNSVQDQLSALFKQLSTARGQLETAKASEKIAKDNLDNTEMSNKLKGLGTSGEQDLAGGINAINDVVGGGKANTGAVQDPTLRAMTDGVINTVQLAQAQMTRLNDFRNLMSDYSQGEIDDISATALRSVERQVKENDRITRAMEFAGIIGGRAQMAPVVEGTLIHEIIQDGLDRIDVIEDKKTTAIRTARKAESEFNYKLFTEEVDIANQLNKDIEDGISKLKTEVRQAEKDEQDRMTFRQEQEKRNSLILAGELTEASPELIQQTAAANGIDLGLLMKAVNDAKFEKANRKFTGEDNALSLLDKQSSINKRNNDMRLDNAGDARAAAAASSEKEQKIVVPADVRQGFRSVSTLSESEITTVWADIQEFGLDNAVQNYLEEGQSPKQIKAIVAGHEQSQRIENDDKEFVPTDTEVRLYNVIDEAALKRLKKQTRDNKNNFISPTDKFFKN